MTEVILLKRAKELIANGEELLDYEVYLGCDWFTYQRGGEWVLWKSSNPACFIAGVQNPTGNVNNARGFSDFSELVEFWNEVVFFFDTNPGEIISAIRTEKANFEESWG